MTQALMFGIGAASAQSVLERATNPYYAKALRLNPAYDEAIALRNKVFAHRGQHALSRPHAPVMPITVEDEIHEWLTATTAAAAAEAEWAAIDQSLAELIAACEHRIQGVGMDRDAILQSLNGDLKTLMAEVKDVVERLDGARTPAQVIAAGTGDAWNELGELRSDYEQIRDAQEKAMLGAPEAAMGRSNYLWDDPLASDTHIANLDDVFPGWRDKQPATYANMSHSWDGRKQPWSKDPIEQLVWLASSAARPWIPTTSQLTALWTRRRERRAHPNGKPTTPPRIHDLSRP
jgi:hypothetical protein